MLKPKSKKGEIGTIVMMALLVIVSLISFGSSNFLSKKQTVNTKAATTTCKVQTPVIKCGSGNNWECTTANGCDPSKCANANLEFNCCVLNYGACSDGSDKYRWYGCTGQFCQNQTISQSNGPGHLVACQSGVGPGKAESCPATAATATPAANTPTPFSSCSVGDCYPGHTSCVNISDTFCNTGSSCSGGICCKLCAATLTPNPSSTPTRTPTPIPCVPKTFTCNNNQTVSYYKYDDPTYCPSNTGNLCFGTSSTNCQEFGWLGLQNHLCGTNYPTLSPAPTATPITTGPTVTTNPNSPSKTPTPTTPLLGDDCGNNYGCNDIFSTTCDDNGKQLPCGSCNRSLADNLTYRCIGAYCNPNYRNAGYSTNLREDCTPVEGENLNCKDTNNFSSRTCQFYCSNKISNYPNKNYYFSTKDTKYYRDNCSLLGESNTEELSENLQSYCACTSIPVGADNVIQSEDGTQYWNCKLAGTSSNKDSATSTCASCQALFGWPNKRQCVITKNSGSSYNTYCCEGGGI